MKIEVSSKELSAICRAVEQRERDFLIASVEQTDSFLRDIDRKISLEYRALAIRLKACSTISNPV